MLERKIGRGRKGWLEAQRDGAAIWHRGLNGYASWESLSPRLLSKPLKYVGSGDHTNSNVTIIIIAQIIIVTASSDLYVLPLLP